LEKVKSQNSIAKSVKSGKSRRSESVTSSRSARSMRLEAAAKSARLRAEIDFLEHEGELRRLQLLKEASIADAEERAFKRIIDEDQISNNGKQIELPAYAEEKHVKTKSNIQFNPVSCIHDNNLDTKHNAGIHDDHSKPPALHIPSSYLAKLVNCHNTEYNAKPETETFNLPRPYGYTQPSTFGFAPSTQATEPIMNSLQQLVQVQTRQAELSALLTKQHVTNHLPVKEPPTFSGNVFDYPAFITAFDAIICDNVLSDKDRLYFLNKYTVGQANEVVKGFLAVNSDNTYKEDRKLLDDRFGPVHVAEAYKSRLRNWSTIKDGDSAGLRTFSDFLICCQEAVRTVGSLNELDSTQTLIKMSAKLPSYSGTKWCRELMKLGQSQNLLHSSILSNSLKRNLTSLMIPFSPQTH
jgi:hypothetical protein